MIENGGFDEERWGPEVGDGVDSIGHDPSNRAHASTAKLDGYVGFVARERNDLVGTEFTNWAKNQRCLPSRIARPEHTDEVTELVLDVLDRGGKVKAVGAGHSFTGTACTDGVLLSLDRMARVHHLDDSTGVITVDAGISLRALNDDLDRRGRALPNLGDIDVQSLAGATATATHGTGLRLPNLSSGIVGFELVDGKGELHWCDAEHHSELFRIGRVSIGALGVITKIALETVPMFTLRAVEGKEPIDAVLNDWPVFAESARHVEFFWMPGGTECYVKRNDPTELTPEAIGRVKNTVDKLLFENVALGAAMRTARRFPSQVPRLRSVIEAAATPSVRVDKSYRIFASPRHVRFVEMEYGIPIAVVPEAFRRLQRLIASLDDPPLFPIEVRTSAADDIPLSTAQGRDTGWIAVHRYHGIPFGEYFRGVEAIMNDYGGRPHWGKLHYQSAETLRDRYPEWEDFQVVRDDLDPQRTFANDYTDRVLGA